MSERTCRHSPRRQGLPPQPAAAPATCRLASVPPWHFCHFHSQVVLFAISLGQVVLFAKNSEFTSVFASTQAFYATKITKFQGNNKSRKPWYEMHKTRVLLGSTAPKK
jgi:hypothetical protein